MKKELLEQLESLRIDVDAETQYCDPTGELRARYEKANEMLNECIEGLNIKPTGIYLDGTLLI